MDRPVTLAADPVPRVVAIVQARMASTRFPGKVLADLAGRPLMEFLLRRLASSREVHDVVVAVPDTEENDLLAAVSERAGARVFRGSEYDVLDRYVRAARWAGADIVVRVTADCPLVDPALVDSVVSLLLADPVVDHAAVGPTYPDGVDCEAVRFSALLAAWEEATLPSEREHVTPFIWSRPERFALRRVESGRDAGHIRITVDEPGDLEIVRALAERLDGGSEAGVEAIIGAIEADPALSSPVGRPLRNEGYRRSLLDEEPPPTGARSIDRSRALWERARRVIPGGTQTLSKAPDQFVRGVSPMFLARGRGCRVWDVDGNSYIDYPMALGPVILGYGYPRFLDAVGQQLAEGSTFTLPHPLETEVAELVVEAVPCAEMVRFCKNGSDATAAAVRLARTVTGRESVAVCGYHGWQDWYIASTTRSEGVPRALRELVHPFSFNDLAGLERILAEREVAAVVFEVGPEDPEDGFLQGMRDAAARHGAVFVWDEIVTGFRFSLGGAQELYGVTPDLACLGKAMANGFPLAAVVGRRDLMEAMGRIFFSTTFGGEAVSLAAARATIEEIRGGGVIPHIWEQGTRLREGLAKIVSGSGLDVTLVGHPPRSGLVFREGSQESPQLRALFLQETVRRGILYGGPIFIGYGHRQRDIELTLEATAEAFEVMRAAMDSGAVARFLDGPPPEPIFRQRPHEP